MVNSSKSKNCKNRKNKGIRENAVRARRINASTPPYYPDGWYRPWKIKDVEYNSCVYQPT